METDEMELDTLGDRKTALFVIISDTDDTFNFVVSILYTQLFNLLCDKADDVVLHSGLQPYAVDICSIGRIIIYQVPPSVAKHKIRMASCHILIVRSKIKISLHRPTDLNTCFL